MLGDIAKGRGIKLHNEYAATLRYFDRIPKSVLAAIAVSYASSGGDYLENASSLVAYEWLMLHQNGIVRQAPPGDVLAIARKIEAKINDGESSGLDGLEVVPRD